MEEQSILKSLRGLLVGSNEVTDFDEELKIHINSVFSILTKMGVGPKDGFRITSDSETWPQFIGESTEFESVKTYVYLKVRLIFDPPSNSAVIDSIKNLINEFEWYNFVAADEEENQNE